MQPETNNTAGPGNTANPMPPRFPLSEPVVSNSLANALKSLVLYVGFGYLLLRRWDLLLVIFGILLLHEAGHFIAMKYYRYADVQVLFLPFIGALVKGSKNEISQRQSIFILLAGPIPGLLLGIAVYFFDIGNNGLKIGDIPLQLIAQLLIWANLLNLLPVYPLDGGQLFNRVYLEEEGLLSDIYFYLSMIVIAVTLVLLKFYILLIVPVLLIYRYIKNRSLTKLDKELEHAGIDVYTSYDELSDEDYWRIRAIIIQQTPAFQTIHPGPPYQYHTNENKIASEVEAALSPRLLLLDASIPTKITLALVWGLAIALPWILNIDFTLFQYLAR
jgi:Zn-dependent protease